MINLLKTETNGIHLFLRRNYNEVVVLGFATLFATLEAYHLVWNQWFSYLLYYAFLPILVILVVMRKNPLDFGLKLGNPRIWAFMLL